MVFRGLVAARLGDTVTALGVARQYLAERRPWLRQAGLNQAGYIYALLGQPERAVVLLREAMNGGARTDYTHEGSLESLRDYPPFQALVRLKW